MRVNPLTKATLIALSTGALVACGGDSNNDSSDGGGSTGVTADAEVRVVHASSDAPNVNASLDGGSQVNGLVYGNATDFLAVPEGDYDVAVDGILPDGSTTNVINASGVNVAADNETSIFAVGNVGSIEPLVVTAPDSDPASDEVRAQVVHASAAASAAGKLDVYVTAPSASLSDASVDPLGTFEFKGDIGPATVPGGDYRIRVTAAGSTSDVKFDSGTVPLSGGSDLLIAAIDNTGPADGPRSSPIRLLVKPEGGKRQILVDKDAKADVRVGHLSSDTSDVDVAVDGNFGSPLFSGVSFPSVTNFTAVAGGTYNLDVDANGDTTPEVELDNVALDGGKRYTAYAVGLSAGSPSIELITSVDDIRSVATEGRLRVAHAASQAGTVDVYLAADGTMESEVSTLDPTLEDFQYKTITEFLSVSSGSYEVFVTPADNPSNVVINAGLTLNKGDVKTVIARDNSGSGFSALPVDDTP